MLRFSELIKEQETFEFVLNDKFFAFFQSDEWEGGDVIVHVNALKRADGITLDMNLNGSLLVKCDRCLEIFPLKVKFAEKLIIKFSDDANYLDANILTISREENQVDLGQFFYEYLITTLPGKKIHPELEDGKTGCDEKMIKKLEEHIIDEENDEIDPRWDELKKIFNKN